MDRSSMTTAERAQAYLRQRRARLSRLIQRPLSPPPASGDLEAEHRSFLREEAEELYWNELSWEQVTEEEGLADSGLVELTFPGFLAFVEGLLLREVMPDSLAPASPRPEVVEDILLFLAARVHPARGPSRRMEASPEARPWSGRWPRSASWTWCSTASTASTWRS
jgi:hypothetical protein